MGGAALKQPIELPRPQSEYECRLNVDFFPLVFVRFTPLCVSVCMVARHPGSRDEAYDHLSICIPSSSPGVRVAMCRCTSIVHGGCKNVSLHSRLLRAH